MGVHHGDHVALSRDGEVEHNELAAVVGPDGTSALWAAQREGARLRLSSDDAASEHVTERHARVMGVVVAVLRRD